MHRLKVLLFLCLLVLMGCTTTDPSTQSDPFNRTRPSDCVALPLTPTPDLRPRTPTPNQTQIADPAFPTSVWITVTPIPIDRKIDLSPKLPYEDKMVILVYRCDGTWNEYTVDPSLFPTAIPLSHGDIIYAAFPPASLMGQKPPKPSTPTVSPR